VEQRKHTLYEIAGLQAVTAKAGEVLYDYAVYLVCPDKLNKLLYRWPLAVGAAVSIINELPNLGVFSLRHG
jgi:hypothetical protein